MITGDLIESGFDTYEAAVRYFESNGYDYDAFGIVGPEESSENDDPESLEGEDMF